MRAFDLRTGRPWREEGDEADRWRERHARAKEQTPVVARSMAIGTTGPDGLVAGESDAGGEYAAYVASYEDDDSEYELVWYVECRVLDDRDTPVILALQTTEANYEDELDLAQEVFDALER